MSRSENVVVVDDAGTPGLLGDDFNPMFVGGDTDGDSELDVGEIWTYTANAAALAGEYVNIATGEWHCRRRVRLNTAPVEANEDDCYTGLKVQHQHRQDHQRHR